MIFKKYQEFVGSDSLNENVQQAKNYLKKLALSAKKQKSKDEEAKLTPEEEKKIENNPNFLKIKDLLKDSPGYTYPFVKFFYDENVPLPELESLFKKIKEYKQFINSLPMSIDKYAEIKPTADDERKGFERLIDDFGIIENGRKTKKFSDQLPGDIRRALTAATPTIKEKVAGIAQAFDELGKESNGKIDPKKNKQLQDLFFNKVKRYKNLNEVIQGALSYIKAASNASTSKFYQNIANVNSKFGEMNGAEMVYDENGILVLEVRSFQANKELNSNTSHCIASYNSHWENYVGNDNNGKFNKQYYVYNFNLGPGDDKSVIGVTIAPPDNNRSEPEGRGKITACHTKSDRSFSSEFDRYIKSIGVPLSVFSPVSPEEVEKRKKRIVANREIVKPKLSVDQVKQYIEDGADPNAGTGRALINAVSENDYEKTKVLLEKGARPEIGMCIKEAKDLKMVKLLVSYGATLTANIYEKVGNDYEAIKYLIEAGLDVNFENGLPLRTAAKNTNYKDATKIMDLLVDAGADISLRRYMVLKWASENGSLDILQYILNKIDELKLNPDEKAILDWLNWLDTSDKLDQKGKEPVYKMLYDYFREKVGKEPPPPNLDDDDDY